ncbi:ATP-binding protein [Limnohabitans sp. Bal53]|uniref:ATP-binding protein n=1 Tax=Limnohabitans sp. Bal53 TaxID=1977910 RepID=UPI001E3F494B|nr:ATP-binding protein [Limnohabitans sp. Bal53]
MHRITHRGLQDPWDTGNGCGLGLAIVKEIVERHAGHVSLTQAQPQGLCVRIELPLAASRPTTPRWPA